MLKGMYHQYLVKGTGADVETAYRVSEQPRSSRWPQWRRDRRSPPKTMDPQ